MVDANKFEPCPMCRAPKRVELHVCATCYESAISRATLMGPGVVAVPMSPAAAIEVATRFKISGNAKPRASVDILVTPYDSNEEPMKKGGPYSIPDYKKGGPFSI